MAIRVLIVDDSIFYRKQLSKIIDSDPRLEIVGTAANGQEAIEKTLTLKPDVITMDIEMPIMNGIDAVTKIMKQRPTPILMLSTWSTEGAKSTLDALNAGAIDFYPKRFDDLSSDATINTQKLCNRLVHLATHAQKKSAPPIIKESNTALFVQKPTMKKKIELVSIATSTGGPVALQKILVQLPKSFPYPIILIQHMPATFTPSFAERLNNYCTINVKLAEDGENLIAGTAYLAPGGKQLLIKGRKNKRYCVIENSQPDQTYKPCVDITLESLSKLNPAETLTIVLTGMGSDGLIGCKKLHALGGAIWSQDKQSSTVYGMPMAIASAGIADRILNLDDIGQQLAELT